MVRFKFIESENDVKKLVAKWYVSNNGYSYAPVQSGRGIHGVPDRVGCVPVKITPEMVGTTVGLFVAVESKAPGRRMEPKAGLAPAQFLQLEGIIDASGVGVLADGEVDITNLDATMKALRQGIKITREIFNRRIGDNG